MKTKTPVPAGQSGGSLSVDTYSFMRPQVLIGCLLLFIGILLRCILAAGTDFTISDAFITFRFAEQFGLGNGLVFNQGEMVGGNTSPLYSLLLGIGAMSGIGITALSRFIGITFDVGVFFLVYRLTARLHSPWLRLAVPVLLFLHPMLLPNSVGGMETTLYLFLIYLLAYFALEGTTLGYCLTVPTLLLCRPDGVLAIAVTMAFLMLSNYKRAMMPLFVVMLSGAAYAAMNYFLYDTLIPPTVAVKAFYGHSSIHENLVYVIKRFFLKQPFIFGAYMLASVAGIWTARRFKPALMFGLLTLAYLFFVLNVPTIRGWYVIPFIYTSFTAILLSVSFMICKISKVVPAFSVLIPVCIFVLLAGIGFRLVYHECLIYRANIATQVEAGGVWIRENTPPDAKILVSALETGYFAKRHTDDCPGLVSPRVFKMLKESRVLDMFQMADVLDIDYVFCMGKPTDYKLPANFVFVKTFCSQIDDKYLGFNESCYSLYKRCAHE
ncbi:MAG: hypothetical protein WCK89_07320 [bacterium]